MKKLLFILAIAVQLFAEAQNTCEPNLPHTVIAQSGIKMRQGPATTFSVVSFVPADTVVLVCSELSAPATFEGISGHWRRVKYGVKLGYMFDGFLQPVKTSTAANKQITTELDVVNAIIAEDSTKVDSILNYLNNSIRNKKYDELNPNAKNTTDSLYWDESAQVAKTNQEDATEATEQPIENDVLPLEDIELLTLVSNFCGDISTIDPGKLWYAVYRKGEFFYRKRVDIEIVRSKYSLGKGLEFDIRSAPPLEVAFFYTASKPQDTTWRTYLPIDYFLQTPNKLFPGQQIEIRAANKNAGFYNVNLFATGSVLEVGKCPKFENYALKVTGEMNDNLITQDLTPDFAYMGDCGQPEIYWFGDINGDIYPDIVFVSVGKQGTYFVLMLSDTRNNGKLYRKADEWFNKNCRE